MTRSPDPRQKPPDGIRNVYKIFQKLSSNAIDLNPEILDFGRGLSAEQNKKCRKVDQIHHETLKSACFRFERRADQDSWFSFANVPIFEHEDIPGLLLIPSLFPRQTQRELLSQLLHQGLANQDHKTNVHAHHQIPYHAAAAELRLSASSQGDLDSSATCSDSFFLMSPNSAELFAPLDPKSHSSFTVSQFLCQKLRWLTLGRQYDWTQKMYPDQKDPPFPTGLKDLTHDLFPKMTPEAAIVNVYSPGNTLSIHRDVSEESNEGLVSISLGCDGVFVAGNESGDGGHLRYMVIRLRSGDAIHMTGSARFAWHGIPQIIPNTCPQWLNAWPANCGDCAGTKDPFEDWHGWMLNKRVNLNIRQVKN